jgi:hypothetical protein
MFRINLIKWIYIKSGSDAIMSRFKNLLMSSLSTALGALGLAQPVLGQQIPRTTVGGVAVAVNKLAIIAPYVVLAGIVAVASAIYIKRRKK